MTTSRTTRPNRRPLAAAAVSLAAASMLLGGLVAGTAIAGAQPTTGGQCAGMVMTDATSGPNPAALTRAGQINASTATSASDPSMPVDCTPASHG
ncbi:MAG: hypothetical protein FGM50_01915 [Mycobacterium sp.]|nr:hypothetical protein [Mycobacterium sp.]